jgi:tripeptide aminopeptidase
MPKQAAATKRKSPKKTAVRAKTSTGGKNAAAPKASAAPADEIDERRTLALVMELMAIRGRSGQEGKVAEYVTRKLRAAGVPAAQITSDNAHQLTPLKGEVGNLILKLPGTLKAPRRLLMAHMDTVPICVGSQPVRKKDFVHSADKATGLGADDRAGVAVILNAALTILEHKLPHPPLTFLWVVQEEVGLFGARHAQIKMLGGPKLAFNWDGGPAGKLTLGATGGYRLTIRIEGLASHAGGAPEAGVSAIAIAGLAIASLVRDGWHGLIQKGDRRGTSNVGVIHGGDATNVVTDRVDIRAEARSHDPKFREEIVAAIRQAFEQAAESVRNVAGRAGRVEFDGRLDYEAFALAADEPCVLAAEAAVRAAGGEPQRAISNGGLDANWMSARGIPTVTLGCGQADIHTTSERLDIGQFQQACRIGMLLATAAEKIAAEEIREG